MSTLHIVHRHRHIRPSFPLPEPATRQEIPSSGGTVDTNVVGEKSSTNCTNLFVLAQIAPHRIDQVTMKQSIDRRHNAQIKYAALSMRHDATIVHTFPNLSRPNVAPRLATFCFRVRRTAMGGRDHQASPHSHTRRSQNDPIRRLSPSLRAPTIDMRMRIPTAPMWAFTLALLLLVSAHAPRAASCHWPECTEAHSKDNVVAHNSDGGRREDATRRLIHSEGDNPQQQEQQEQQQQKKNHAHLLSIGKAIGDRQK